MPFANAAPDQQQGSKSLVPAALLIIVGFLATTLAQPQLLGYIPLKNLLKNDLHADRAANAAFFFWIQMAWYFKPFAGILTDAFPLFGSRRRSYLLISGSLAALAWFALGFTPHQYGKLLAAGIVVSIFMVVASTVVGAFMVEAAQASGGSGRLTAVRNFTEQFCYIISGPTAGYLGSIAFGWTAAACGGVMFLVVPGTILFLNEQRKKVKTQELLDQAGRQLVKIATAGTMWAAAGFMALFYCAPGVMTAVFYKQQNDLHMTTQGQGFLQFLQGVGGVTAAVLYGLSCRRFNLRKLLVICLLFGTAADLGYLFYSSVGNARMVETFWGFGWTLADMSMMDLAIRATPAGSEGLGFSLMMSVRNLAYFGSDWMGSKLLETYHLQFSTLVLANGATSFLAVPLVLLLPGLIVNRKDAEAAAAAPVLPGHPA